MGYGNMIIGFCADEFAAFRQMVQDLHDQPLPPERKQLKYIVVPVPSDRIRLLLCRNELDGLHTMLEAADDEIKARQLIKLFTPDNKRM